MAPPVRIQLSQPLRAVKLQEHPGSSLRSPTRILVEIPAGIMVELKGPVAPSGLCNILWNGDAFSAFYEDLRDSGQILNPAAQC